jgi:hypothetical protein
MVWVKISVGSHASADLVAVERSSASDWRGRRRVVVVFGREVGRQAEAEAVLQAIEFAPERRLGDHMGTQVKRRCTVLFQERP